MSIFDIQWVYVPETYEWYLECMKCGMKFKQSNEKPDLYRKFLAYEHTCEVNKTLHLTKRGHRTLSVGGNRE